MTINVSPPPSPPWTPWTSQSTQQPGTTFKKKKNAKKWDGWRLRVHHTESKGPTFAPDFETVPQRRICTGPYGSIGFRKLWLRLEWWLSTLLSSPSPLLWHCLKKKCTCMAERKCGSRRCVSFFLELISSIWQTLLLLIENLREIYWCEQKMRWDEVIRMGTCWGQVTAVLEIDIGPYIRPLTKRKYWESADRPDGKIDEEGTWNQSRYQRGKWPWWRGGSEKKFWREIVNMAGIRK